MQWSITVGRVAGIAVRVHVTFLILLAWIGFTHYLVGGPAAAIAGLIYIVAIFGSVLLHEFGHALAARRFGVETPDITLLPIGGVARLERIPDKPKEELIVALAGPAVNVGIALILGLILYITRQTGTLSQANLMAGPLTARILWVNIMLVLFNLIPAFPMDGGRILRALLAERMSYTKATQIAASVGQAFAFLFALIGFFFNPFLIFIALFVYMGATGEVSTAQLRDFARGVPVSSVMVTRFRTLPSNATLSQAVTALLEGAQREFPIIGSDGRIAGLLSREDVIRALSEKGIHAAIDASMQSDIPIAHPSEMLANAFHRMMAGGHSAIPVVDGHGNIVGLLTRENISEMMMVQDALRKA